MRIEPASHLQPAGTVLPPNEACAALARRLAAETAGRGAVRRRLARPLRHRRLDLPDHAGRRVRAEDASDDVADRDRHRARPEGAGAGARRRHQPVRPDHRRGAGHRQQQAPAPRARRSTSDARTRHGRAGHRARPPERAAQAARPVVPGRRVHQRAGHAGRHGGQQLLRLALHRLRQHGAQRARRERLAVRRRAGRLRPGRRRSARAARDIAQHRAAAGAPAPRARSTRAGPR